MIAMITEIILVQEILYCLILYCVAVTYYREDQRKMSVIIKHSRFKIQRNVVNNVPRWYIVIMFTAAHCILTLKSKCYILPDSLHKDQSLYLII